MGCSVVPVDFLFVAGAGGVLPFASVCSLSAIFVGLLVVVGVFYFHSFHALSAFQLLVFD